MKKSKKGIGWSRKSAIVEKVRLTSQETSMFRPLTSALLILSLPCVLAGQDLPGKPHIYSAAQQINSVSPPTMPEQTITIGTFNGGTNTFHFLLEPSYPPGTQDFKKVEYGGDVPPQYVAEINSYNVKYEFNIVDRPAGFGITVEVYENGQLIEKAATINSQGTRATVSFNPRSARQRVKIQRPGGDTSVFVWPHLKEQLGAFIVPYMLVAIVFEPPGSGSTSNYGQTSTANTVVSWGFARSSGLVETIDPEAMMNLFNEAMGAGLNALYPGAGTVWTTLAGLREQTTVTKTTTQTTSTTESQGVSISVTSGFNTVLHQYPGGGDLFILLRDVLFAYIVKDGKVLLSPMAYSGVTYQTAAEMRQLLPAGLADRFLALNPHFNARLAPMTRAPTDGLKGPRTPILARNVQNIASASRFQTFTPYAQVECKDTGSPELIFSKTDFQSTEKSQATTETLVEHVTGLVASIAGGGDQLHSMTYSTATQQGTAQTQSTEVTLLCSADDKFWVRVYFDNLFRTFLTIRGEPLSGVVAVAGTAQKPGGQPAGRQNVTLKIGGETYVVLSDADGNFSFPISALPRGAGQLVVGNETYNITYEDTPKNLLLRGGVVTDKTVQPPAVIKRPPVRPRRPE